MGGWTIHWARPGPVIPASERRCGNHALYKLVIELDVALGQHRFPADTHKP